MLDTERSQLIADTFRELHEQQQRALIEQYGNVATIARNTILKMHMRFDAYVPQMLGVHAVERVTVLENSVVVTFKTNRENSFIVPASVFFAKDPVVVAQWVRNKVKREAGAYYQNVLTSVEADLQYLEIQKTELQKDYETALREQRKAAALSQAKAKIKATKRTQA